MAENKTQPTELSVEAYLSAIGDEGRRNDCRAIAALMAKITKAQPVMWGTSIVGFDSYHYTYASGREGDACATGFSSRKGDISVYLCGGGPRQEELLALLGRHKMGKACLYIRKLADIDMAILERLIVDSVAEIKRLYA
ncbi:MAG: DUF1801 domain-containing protein [Pseudomonadota bacterium]